MTLNFVSHKNEKNLSNIKNKIYNLIILSFFIKIASIIYLFIHMNRTFSIFYFLTYGSHNYPMIEIR